MEVNRSILIFTILAISSSVAIAKDYKAPQDVSILNSEQLLSQIVGNTLGTVYWSQYHAPATNQPHQGEIRGFGQTAKDYVGTWSINGPVMCFEYHHPHTSSYNGFYTTSLKDGVVTWYDLDGRRWYDPGGRIKLLPGNPKDY